MFFKKKNKKLFHKFFFHKIINKIHKNRTPDLRHTAYAIFFGSICCDFNKTIISKSEHFKLSIVYCLHMVTIYCHQKIEIFVNTSQIAILACSKLAANLALQVCKLAASSA